MALYRCGNNGSNSGGGGGSVGSTVWISGTIEARYNSNPIETNTFTNVPVSTNEPINTSIAELYLQSKDGHPRDVIVNVTRISTTTPTD